MKAPPAPMRASELPTIGAQEAGAPDPADPSAVARRPGEIAFLADGTLVVATDHEVVTVDAANAVRRAALPPGARALLGADADAFSGVVLERGDEAALLATPSLATLFTGRGRPMWSSPGVIAIDGPRPAVVLQAGGELRRFTWPPGLGGATAPGGAPAPIWHAESVIATVDGARAVVTWTSDDGDAFDASVHDTATGALIGRAYPMPAYASVPRAILHANAQLAIDGETLVELDLVTGQPVRRAKIACPKDQALGNPLPSPRGDHVVVTCGQDGLVLDGRTLKLKRRVPLILPGCDNGDVLPALYRESAPSDLVVEGCGGEARIDLRTGKYRCGDNEGVVGAPYAMEPGVEVRAPHARRALPRCTEEAASFSTPLGTSGRYRVGGEEGLEIVGGAQGAITLEEGAGFPVMSRDEARIAYARDDRVIIRSMPDGAPLLELAYRRTP